MNIFNNLLHKNKTSNDSDYEKKEFVFDNIHYNIKDILKISNLLPIKTYSLSVLHPILETIIINIDTIKVFDIASFLKHIMNSDISYLILLQVNDNHFEYVYGYEYVIKQLMNNKSNFAVKIITTETLQTIYIKNRKFKKEQLSNPT